MLRAATAATTTTTAAAAARRCIRPAALPPVRAYTGGSPTDFGFTEKSASASTSASVAVAGTLGVHAQTALVEHVALLYRTHGHRAAAIDPLGRTPPRAGVDELLPTADSVHGVDVHGACGRRQRAEREWDAVEDHQVIIHSSGPL
jgi:2-oxoglutarate dehydrogenase complex dehydrogenase (E1) component-like enzyme